VLACHELALIEFEDEIVLLGRLLQELRRYCAAALGFTARLLALFAQQSLHELLINLIGPPFFLLSSHHIFLQFCQEGNEAEFAGEVASPQLRA